ncbi:unnamed protein product, partial [Sphacelaria rigidula]
QVSSAVELLGIRKGTCFEARHMFGFDVLVDSELKPHLMEVNFAPSLNTDSALDLKVKSKVVADLLTLAGIRDDPGRLPADIALRQEETAVATHRQNGGNNSAG